MDKNATGNFIAELDRTIYAETNMVKCKVDDIKSIYLMK